MNMRFAKEEEIDNIREIWNYCFNDDANLLIITLIISMTIIIQL